MGPACQLHLLPLALPRRPAPFLPPVRREPAPALLPFLPGAWPPGARARARTPPLPSRSTANGSQAPSLPPKRGSLLLRGLHARGLARRTRRPAPALVQASSAGAATPTGSPAAVDAPHPAISPPIQALGKVPCKFLLLPSSSTSPSRATGAGNGSAPPWLGCPRADELFRPAAPAPAGAPGAPHLGEPKPGSFPTGSSPSTSLPPESDDFLSVAAAASRG